MSSWIGLILSFTTGLVSGGVLVFSWCKSKLRFYKQFIEKRLNTTILARSSKPSILIAAEFPPGKAPLSPRPEPTEESDRPQSD